MLVLVEAALTPGPAAKTPAVAGIAVLVAVTRLPAFEKSGAVIAPGTVTAAVTPLVVAAELSPPMTTPPPPSPPAPLVMTGVGAELIEEFTVCCGLAINAGGITCPVGVSMP